MTILENFLVKSVAVVADVDVANCCESGRLISSYEGRSFFGGSLGVR